MKLFQAILDGDHFSRGFRNTDIGQRLLSTILSLYHHGLSQAA